MISREHAPPMNPSMRPSGKTIARSLRCADTGARRATTVATAKVCPWRRNAAIRSRISMSRRQRQLLADIAECLRDQLLCLRVEDAAANRRDRSARDGLAAPLEKRAAVARVDDVG